jgi:aspartyl-tRNA(Asn)/glutamyl-tRNA(Gln) amidotransferase subunit A
MTDDLCRHGRHTGTYARGAELGAFVAPPDGLALPSSGGALTGTLVAVKDNIDVAGWPTRAGSEAIGEDPASADAPAVARLRHAGADIAAKTRMDEFAMTTYGPEMRNHHDEARSVGGSSGGSGLAVAAGGFCLALGTDTGGSVRIPASYCGVTGFKPTFGRIPLEGVIPLSDSLDHVGVFGCSVTAVREAFAVLRGDSAETPQDAGPFPLEGLHIGIPGAGYLAHATDPVRRAFDATVETLRSEGAVIVEVDLPEPRRVLDVQYTIGLSEALWYHDDRFPDLERHGATMREVLERAREFSPTDYDEAQRARAVFTDEVARLFNQIDLLATPTTPTVAPVLGQPQMRLGTGDVDTLSGTLWYTAVFNGSGLPAISIPVGDDSLPIGFQLITRRGDDEFLLEVAERVEQITNRFTSKE